MSTPLCIRGDEGAGRPAYTLIGTMGRVVQKLLQVILQEITKSLSIVYAFLCELWVAIFLFILSGIGVQFVESNALWSLQVIKEVMQLDEKTYLTDKNIKIETGAGNTVNVTCSYTERATLEALLLSYLERETIIKRAA